MKCENDVYGMIQDCYRDVVRYLRKFGLSDADLDDAIQDTFVEAFASANNLREPDKVKNWLIKIAKSKGMRYKRKNSILITIECAFREDVVQLDCADTYKDDILEELILDSDINLLNECMKKLKKKERDVIIHQYIYDEKLKDIAVIIGESLNNTKSISRRAKEKVRNFLIDGGYEHGR